MQGKKKVIDGRRVHVKTGDIISRQKYYSLPRAQRDVYRLIGDHVDAREQADALKRGAPHNGPWDEDDPAPQKDIPFVVAGVTSEVNNLLDALKALEGRLGDVLLPAPEAEKASPDPAETRVSTTPLGKELERVWNGVELCRVMVDRLVKRVQL